MRLLHVCVCAYPCARMRIISERACASLIQIPGMCAWFSSYEWCKRSLSESSLPLFYSPSGEATGPTTVLAGVLLSLPPPPPALVQAL